MISEANISFSLIQTERPNHAREVVMGLRLQEWDGIVTASGDGLLFEVVNGLLSRPDWAEALRTPLGVLPCGTGNGLAATISWHWGLSPARGLSLLQNCSLLLCRAPSSRRGDAEGDNTGDNSTTKPPRGCPLDLVSVTTSSGKRLFSFLSVAWGLVADVDVGTERLRRLGPARFALGTVTRLLSLQAYRGRLSYLPALPRSATTTATTTATRDTPTQPHTHPGTALPRATSELGLCGGLGDSGGDSGDNGGSGESSGDNGGSNGDNGDNGDSNRDIGDSNGDNGDSGDIGDNGESGGDNGDVGDSGVELGDSVGDGDSLWGGDSVGVGDKSRFGDNVGLGATSKLGDSPGQKDTKGDTPSDSATSSLGDTSSFGDTPSDNATKTPGATKTDSATSSPDATKLHGATSNVGDTSSFGDTSSLEDTPSDSATKTPCATKLHGATSSFEDTPSDNATKPHGATSSSGDTSSLGDTPSATSATSPPVGGPVDDLLVPLGHPVPPGWVTLEGDFVLVLALTQSHLGTELVAVPQARPDDGLIHLCYVRAGVSRATLLRALVAMSRGGLGDGGVTGATPLCHVPARAFRLEPLPPAGTMTVDGERVEVGDIQGQIHRGLARLLLPPGPP